MDILHSILIYLATFASSVLFMALSEHSRCHRRFFAVLAIVIPSVTAMYRECGVDFWTYKDLYNHIHSGGEGYTEWLWNILNRLAPTYQILLFVTAFLFLYVVYRAIGRMISRDKALSWLVVLTIPYICFYNGMRQMLAVSFVFLAMTYVFERRYAAATVLILIGGGFHNTAYLAIVFLLMYMILIRKKRHYVGLVALISLVLVAGAPLIVSLMQLLGIYSKYSISENAGGSIAFLLYLLPPLFFFYYDYGKRKSVGKIEHYCLAIYLLSIPFQLLGNIMPVTDRFMWYTQIFIAVLVPMIIHDYDKVYAKHNLRLVYYVWFIFSYIILGVLMNSNATYPYRIFG